MGKNGIHQAIRSAGATQRWFGLDMGNDVSAALNAVIGPGQEAILCQLEALIIRVIDHVVPSIFGSWLAVHPG